MPETKENIKDRMLKNAARMWGFTDVMESQFDPLISLLLTSCATELEKISGEIHASRARVLERLIQLLTPEALTSALPAHSIATATARDSDVMFIDEFAQLYTRIKMLSSMANEKDYLKDLFFSPTGTFTLNKASVCYLAAGRILYKITNNIEKEIIAVSNSRLPESTLWLAIDEPTVSLHNASFYFDLRNDRDKHLFFHQLPKAVWNYQSFVLPHIPGYGNREICGESFDAEELLNNENTICSKLKKRINAFYKPNFITLLDNEERTVNKQILNTPEIIISVFTQKETALLHPSSLRWLTIQFPETISSELLQDITCIMNCFPIINRRHYETRFQLKELTNIFPLHTEDTFLDLHEVRDEENNLIPKGQSSIDKNLPISMMLRNGGIGRFDERSAGEIVEVLLHLLRDESAAFNALGNVFMNNEVQQLQQVMYKLEQKLSSQSIQPDSLSYLVFHKQDKSQAKNLFIKYWSTNGHHANDLKAGTALQVYKDFSISNNQAVLVDKTRGGIKKLSPSESVLAYKSALLSKERLVTTQDIKAFCHYHLGERINLITIKKGVMVHPDEQQGYRNTIDVEIELHPKAYAEIAEKDDICFWESHLKLLLEEKSMLLMHFRVTLKKIV